MKRRYYRKNYTSDYVLRFTMLPAVLNSSRLARSSVQRFATAVHYITDTEGHYPSFAIRTEEEVNSYFDPPFTQMKSKAFY